MSSAAVMLGSTVLIFAVAFPSLPANGQVVDDEVVGGAPKGQKLEPQKPGLIKLSEMGFDRMLASGAATPEMLRIRMGFRLESTLETVRNRCGLNETQCDRLEFAGRRDISRLIETVERMRRSYVGTEHVERDARVQTEIFRHATLPSLQQFAHSSLFRKVARKQLSDAQWEQYLEFDREQQEAAACKTVAYYFGMNRELTKSQELAVSRLLLDRFPQWRPISTHITFSEYVAARIAGELEAELQPILDESQFRHLQRQASIAKRIEPDLIKLGLWPIPQEANEEPRPTNAP